MEFRILGPFEVVAEGSPLELGGTKQRALLATLLLRPNQPVSVDRLIEDLWEGNPPKTASHVIQVYVSQLRKAIGGSVLVTRKPGYLVSVTPETFDLFHFERLAEEGRAALVKDDADTASGLLRDALAMWRGTPLADFTYDAFAQSAIARLEEIRQAVLEERIDADLRLGRHAQLVGELETLVEESPLRERPRGQLMLALYRSGRQAEALEAYRRARQALTDELGIDPSQALQELERAILRQDESLELERRDTGGRVAAPVAAVPAATRAILVAGASADELESQLPLAELLAEAKIPHQLILLGLLEPGADMSEEGARLQRTREDLDSRGVSSRVAAFRSDDHAGDVLRMAAQQDVDLLLFPPTDVRDGVDERLETILGEAPCDVAFRIGGRSDERAWEGGSVIVPFGGGEHEWAALELGAWAASAAGLPLRLVGIEGDPDGVRRDAGRLLATAALAVQQLAGIATDALLVEPGPEQVVRAAEGARLVFVGLPADWRSEGIGAARIAIATAAEPAVYGVRRGARPGGMSPPEGLTRYTWSVMPPA